MSARGGGGSTPVPFLSPNLPNSQITQKAEGRDAAFDITVINPLQQATVAQAAETPGHSLDFAFNRKMRGTADECERPLAFESLGGWHRTVEKQVKKLAQAVARQTGVDESECCSQATSRLSLI